MPTKQVHAAVICHKGCVRKNNEDNFFFNGDYMSLNAMNDGAVIDHTFSGKALLFGVFDGMGGGDWGERASAMAAQSAQQVYMNMARDDLVRIVDEYALKTNARIVADGRSHQVDTQGTTMALLILKNESWHVANVGDSRVYMMRGHTLTQISMDHSVVGNLVRDGQMTAEQARKSSKNNVITQYLGMPDEERPQKLVYHHSATLQTGDRFMLCSDGLSDLLPDSAIEETMASTPDPMECAKKMVLTALEMGGKDNTTCIILDAGNFIARLPKPPQTEGFYPGIISHAQLQKERPEGAMIMDEDEDTAQIKAMANAASRTAKPAEDQTQMI